MSKFCPHCGSPVEDDAFFCGSCGGPIPSENQAPGQQPVYEQNFYEQPPCAQSLQNEPRPVPVLVFGIVSLSAGILAVIYAIVSICVAGLIGSVGAIAGTLVVGILAGAAGLVFAILTRKKAQAFACLGAGNSKMVRIGRNLGTAGLPVSIVSLGLSLIAIIVGATSRGIYY